MTVRFAVLAFLSIWSAVPALASGCDDGEQPLMGCEIADAKGGYDGTAFMLCGIPPESGEKWTGLHYVFDRAGVREFSYPSNPAQARPVFFSHHIKFQGLYRFRVRFENGGYTYEIYVEENPPPTDPDEIQSVDAGVRVFKGGKMVGGEICGESPNPFYSYILQSTACDLKTPYGEEVCGEHPLDVK